ncbi:MAG: hypothetical protein AVDCRST_MAG77-42 [uncultured Chloroflexi bacterium]|uniref:Uncharacterized protein n=1 Tax=uncultured Chloroflexota bacterium TaxID=166587 RepID=A0A6J4H2S7_9CHLR|nr:MAG: hypothetical protein AVDCRST_MAG77-42 [uncultured Chloroflexota bacterium]
MARLQAVSCAIEDPACRLLRACSSVYNLGPRVAAWRGLGRERGRE